MILGYLMPNPAGFCIYITHVGYALVDYYGKLTIVGYLMLNPVFTYILDTDDLVWFGFMAYQLL